MRRAAFVAIALAAGVAIADPEAAAELERAEAELARIQQAQTGVFQQFQMAQALRQAELARGDPFAPQGGGIAPPPMDYNELVRLRERRERRIRELGAELDRLYARYQALEAQKQALAERIGELAARR